MTQLEQSDPEIGRSIQLGDVTVNVHDVGAGPPVLLIHGSGLGARRYLVMDDSRRRARDGFPSLPQDAVVGCMHMFPVSRKEGSGQSIRRMLVSRAGSMTLLIRPDSYGRKP